MKTPPVKGLLGSMLWVSLAGEHQAVINNSRFDD